MINYKSQAYHRESLKVLEILEDNGFKARLAGGCVRDRVMGQPAKDIDIATDAKPDEVSLIFKQKNFRTVPTGIDHGTITIIGKFGAYEVTTLRRDVVTDGRHAKVVFGESFQEDALRRDFTMNAMFQDREGQIYDYFLGRKHIEEGVLKFVGDAKKRIKEDYLRILRLYRFWARFNLKPDRQALEAIEELGAGLRQISQERITSELLGTFKAANPEDACRDMFRNQIMLHVLPDARKIDNKAFKETKAIKNDDSRAIARISLLVQHIEDPDHVSAIGKKLRLSKKQIEKLNCLVILGGYLTQDLSLDQAEQMDLIDLCEKNGSGFLIECCLPTWRVFTGSNSNLLDQLHQTELSKGHLRCSKLPVSANDLMQALKISAGRKLGKILDELKRLYRNEVFTEKSEALEIAKKLV